MSTSIMIHDVSDISVSGGVQYSNSNSVTMNIQTRDGGYYSITVFGLAVEAADHLARSLFPGAVSMSEEAIRADERRIIRSKLGL